MLLEVEHFEKTRAVLQAEARTSCAFYVRGCCRLGENCRRGMKADSEYSGSGDEEGSEKVVGVPQHHQGEAPDGTEGTRQPVAGLQ